MSTDPVVGLPDRVRACLFDLDGVLTDTAKVHAAAWKEMFDAYLRARAENSGESFVAFDEDTDYDTYVDGKTRADGTRSFLQSRHIALPDGAPGDPANAETITGLGNAKNEIVLRKIRADGVRAYAGSVRYVRAVRAAGLRRAVVSSSTNCADVLAAAGIAELFETRIAALPSKRSTWPGNPRPTPTSPPPVPWV
jgi:beta-phosphoglucomutase-like phosphatase (HAD superfamily)